MVQRWSSQASRDPLAYFITWTTYGTWLPGDARGWRRRQKGFAEGEPRLEAWCANRMRDDSVLLRPADRKTVATACRQHAAFRAWELLAVYAGTNHVHLVVAADAEAKKARDQFKANCTRALRDQTDPLRRDKTWTTGGDCAILWTEKDIEDAVRYVTDGQTERNE